MEACGEAESRLAGELMQHELQLEKDILDPVNQLAEVRLGDSVVIVRVIIRGRLLIESVTVSLPGGDSQHPETEKTTGQAGSGLRLSEDPVPSLPTFCSTLGVYVYEHDLFYLTRGRTGGTRRPSPTTRPCRRGSTP